MDPVLNVEFVKNSLVVDSPEMEAIRKCAADNEMVVCLGFSERSGGTLYIAQCTINSDGYLLVARRKLKPIHMERTVFGDGHGPSLRNVAQTPVGRVGALSCGVSSKPLCRWPILSSLGTLQSTAKIPHVLTRGGNPRCCLASCYAASWW